MCFESSFFPQYFKSFRLINCGKKNLNFEMSSILIKASFKNVCGFITPNNILDIHPYKDFFIQTLVVNNK